MKALVRRIAALVLVSAFCSSSAAFAAAKGRTPYLVNDYAGFLAPAQRSALEARLKEAQKTLKVEIVLSTFEDTEGKDSEFFISDYLSRWRRWYPFENDRRIHLIFIKNPGIIRVGVGVPLLKKITPARTNRIINEIIIPRFDQQKYHEGMEAAILDILTALK